MQTRRSFFAVQAAFALVDWPQWRGPNRDGEIPPEDGQPLPEKLKRVWTVAVGEGHSSPVVSGTRVFQLSRSQDAEAVAAYELDSGKQIWRQTYPAPYEMNSAATSHGKGPKSTPVVAGDHLFTLGINGILSGWDATNGKKLWTFDSKGSPEYGQASSPVVDRGTLIASVGPQNGGGLAAFDPGTGKIRWQWKEDGPAYASPVIAEPAGVRQVITNSQSNIVGVAVADGKLLWKMPLKTPYDQNSVTPLVVGDMVIYSGLSNPVTAIRPGPQPQKVWENKEVGMYMNSPVMAGGILWGLSHKNKGQFFGIEPKTGKTVWTGEGRQADNAAMLARGTTLFALTTNAELLVFRASSSGLQHIANYTVADTPTWAHPAILGNRVLVKDQGSLSLWSAA